MTVYADILFLVNLSLNWFSLILTSKIMKLKSSAVKMLSAAALGALAGIITVFFSKTPTVALVEIASTFLMCAVAFKAYSFFGYIKMCTCLFASGITIGGSLTLIYSFFNRAGIELQQQNDISTAVFILLSFAVTVAALVFERLVTSSKSTSHGELTLEIDGKRAIIPYFCDSGNFLREPISGKPAVIVSARYLSALLPSDILDTDPDLNSIGTDRRHRRLRLLPASTVCGKSIMLGVIPDKIMISDKNVRELDAIIAIDKSNDGISRRFAIVPASLI